MLSRLLRAIIPAEIMVAMGEVDIVFMKDGSPLEGGT